MGSLRADPTGEQRILGLKSLSELQEIVIADLKLLKARGDDRLIYNSSHWLHPRPNMPGQPRSCYFCDAGAVALGTLKIEANAEWGPSNHEDYNVTNRMRSINEMRMGCILGAGQLFYGADSPECERISTLPDRDVDEFVAIWERARPDTLSEAIDAAEERLQWLRKHSL